MQPVSLVLPGHAISSLRESDFDTCSAIGEVIDNSLQADATAIHILVEEKELPPQGRRAAGTKVITGIAFGDDGHGMDTETLHRCMQLGYSTRYDDRSGIGRFGVGMTLGAINQCLRIDVYSKQKSATVWHHTFVDLSKVVDDANIPEPKTLKELPPAYRKLTGTNHGTLVVWSYFDRQAQPLQEIQHWIARTYRRFLGDYVVQDGAVTKNPTPVSLTINDQRVEAFDPLYAIRSSHFPSDDVAELFEPIEILMPVPTATPGKDKLSKITIQLSLTPKSWRTEGGGAAGRSAVAEKLHLKDNEGFSILRADREVFYDTMPHFEPKVSADGIDRWWSAEISFDPVLDTYFSVRNIKRGARFVRELREKIQEQMRMTILHCREQVHTLWKQKPKATEGGKDNSLEHSPAENTVKEANPTPGKSGRDKTSEEKKREVQAILAPIVLDATQLEEWRAKIESQPCTIVDNPGSHWKGATFLDLHFQGGRTIIEYNMAHAFFVFVYGRVNELLKQAQANEVRTVVDSAQELKIAIDLLFMAYAQAESMADPSHEQKQGDTLEMLRNNWGVFLEQFVRARDKA
jgi:hypothetical protein